MQKFSLPGIGRCFSVAVLFCAAWLLAVPPYAFADPPPWAPAHGWRKKHDPYYLGYTGKKWDNDYGIVVTGRCNREAVGAVVGGVVGGVVGSQIGKGEDRKIATLVGAVLGAVVGAKIGRDMDQADRACVAHALELAKPKTSVTWTSADNQVSYRLTPVRDFKQADSRVCRDFTLKATGNGRSETTRGTACQAGEGTWQIVGPKGG